MRATEFLAELQQPMNQPIDLLSIGMANKDAEEVLHRSARAAGMKGAELAQFLGQCFHETGGFSHLQEIGNKNYGVIKQTR